MVRLHLGCGENRLDGFVNVDCVKTAAVDKVWDLDKYPYPWRSNSVDEVVMVMVLEHMKDTQRCIEELHRICKPGAIIKLVVPFYNHHLAHTDIQHKKCFTTETFDTYTDESRYKYYHRATFKVLEKRLRPSPIGRLVPTQRLLNMCAMVFGQLAESIYFELEVMK